VLRRRRASRPDVRLDLTEFSSADRMVEHLVAGRLGPRGLAGLAGPRGPAGGVIPGRPARRIRCVATIDGRSFAVIP
jgi:hypothetical protein